MAKIKIKEILKIPKKIEIKEVPKFPKGYDPDLPLSKQREFIGLV